MRCTKAQVIALSSLGMPEICECSIATIGTELERPTPWLTGTLSLLPHLDCSTPFCEVRIIFFPNRGANIFRGQFLSGERIVCFQDKEFFGEPPNLGAQLVPVR